MSIKIKEDLMQKLCYDLTDNEVEKLVQSIKEKILKGYSMEEIAHQLMTAICQVVLLASPELSDDWVRDISEDVADVLIDRVLDYEGYPVDERVEEVLPYDQLN